ncbi:TPA: hypothetical protein HA251_02355 [Candidatus Woesearchaeota archaeon]|nr:hypothetical protein [Candidatus Woesearchaeota archaeon]
MIEHFKPAGHKAQDLSDIVLPKETFKPIQRVVKRPNFLGKLLGKKEQTVGYLYRDVEYKRGYVDDVVLSAGLLGGRRRPLCWAHPEWKQYEEDEIGNPAGWFVPSGPLIAELCYRTQQDGGPIGNEAQQSWHKTFDKRRYIVHTSTIIDYNEGNAHITHDQMEPGLDAEIPASDRIILSETSDPVIEKFLYGLFGKRYNIAHTVFGRYGTPVQVWIGSRHRRILSLNANIDNNFYIDADNSVYNVRSVRGVAVAKTLLNNKRYEVRDD